MGFQGQFSTQDAGILTERRVPPTLAGLLADLELEQPQIVSLEDLRKLRNSRKVHASVHDIAKRLQGNGWLLPLRTRGVYEFAPAARAGNIASGDAFVELRATLKRRPDLRLMVAEESASWLHGLSSRAPERHVVSAPLHFDVPPALQEFRCVRLVPQLPPKMIDGLPVWSIESLLVLMATKPSLYGDWPNVNDWLHNAFSRADQSALYIELKGKPQAAIVRFAYLLEHAGYPSLAQEVYSAVDRSAGPIYFGKDRGSGTYDSRYGVVDSVLSDQPSIKL